MMKKLIRNISLRPLNTFGVEAGARYYLQVERSEDLEEVISSGIFRDNEVLILGGGSNILFTRDFEGLVLHSGLTEKKVLYEDDHETVVMVSSGLLWDDFVGWSLEQGYYGLENLSWIPGNVGAAPVQNIGAYGFEAGEAIVGVEGFDLITGEMLVVDHEACHFSYRSSIFKEKLKDSFFITGVVFRLSRKPVVNLSYPQLAEAAKQLTRPAPEEVRDLVISIRKAKLPDPSEYGNAGSFFKNPVVSSDQADLLQSDYPGMPRYPAGNGKVKIPAGWLIEQCGWKGRQKGRVGVWEKQALVIVNLGGATGQEILDFSEQIREEVRTKFAIALEREVRVL